MDLVSLIAKYPEITIFLSILLGYLVAKAKIGHFSLGPVVGTLLAGLVVGIAVKPVIPDIVRWAFFDLFLFAIGYSVGPQFFSSIKKSAIPQIIIAVVVNVSGLLAVIAGCYFMRFDQGTTLGVLSGSLTQSAALGTGISALSELPLPEEQRNKLIANVPIADALTYVFGDLGLILMMIIILPALFKVNLRKECEVIEAELKKNSSSSSESFFQSPNKETIRAYVLTNADFFEKTLQEIEKSFSHTRVFIDKVLRDGKFLEITPSLKVIKGDTITFAGWRSGFINGVEIMGPEVDNNAMLSVETAQRKIFITNKQIDGVTLGKLSEQGRGLFLKKITRGGVELPVGPNLELHRGDAMYLMGSPTNLDRVTKLLGFAESDPKKSDLAFIGACICIGIIMGMFSFKFKDVPLGLGASGSILVVGLIAGWAQKRFPRIGSIPEAAQQILIDIGLIVFIAVIGLKSGPHAVEAIQEGGFEMVLKIFTVGAIATIVGPIFGFLVGRYILKQNGATTLATIGGAQTVMVSLNALQDASGSKVLATYFTLPYAIGNILLTLWGPVIVAVSNLWQ